jgi:hypothetical protein
MVEEEKNGAENHPIKKQGVEKPEKQEPIDRLIEKQSIIEGIFEETKSLTEKQVSNKNKNKPEIIDLISGGQLDLTVLASEIQKHPPQFFQEYYDEIYRVYLLKGNQKDWRKEKVCADLTIQCVYSRFKKDVLPTIQLQNKYKGYCEREHRYYQFLNPDGITMLKTFINDTLVALQDSNSEYEFRKIMFERHGVDRQLDAFKD